MVSTPVNCWLIRSIDFRKLGWGPSFDQFTQPALYLVQVSDLPWVALASDYFTSERPLHVLLKAIRVLSELCGRLMVEWVIGIWFKEEEYEAHDDVADVEDWLPIGS